ncbi:3-oxoacyl-[acyl-carrier-protein] synthase III C-terminal domain-containing protein [Streptomyces sp. NPDC054796]
MTRSHRGAWAESGISITGFGHYYPERLEISSDDPETFAELGVRTRHVSSPDETVPVMAGTAVRRALAAAGRGIEEVDLLILANCTTRRWFPEAAPRVAHEVGAHRALAFDVCGACAGFVHGIQLCASLLSTLGGMRLAVVVASEQFSRRARPQSRSARVVGDAAAAAVLARDGGSGLLDSVLHTTGAEADICTIGPEDGWMHTDPQVAELAFKTQSTAADELLERTGLTLADVDWVVPHPGTRVVQASLRDHFARAGASMVTNFETCGNTASAAIPGTVSENLGTGLFRRGQLVLAPTAGAGWYYGGLLIRL